jgi:hypothetical protein
MSKGPKPLIEEHYHIQELIERQEKRSAERTYFQEKVKLGEERIKEIADAKVQAQADFLCRKCGQEFKGVAVRQVEVPFNGPPIAYYKHKCDKGHWCMRYITEKWKDPYWVRSKAVARDKGKRYKDMIQPHEEGFNLLYKKI